MVSEQVLGTRGAHWGGLGEVAPVGTKDQANHQENLRWPSWIRKRPAIARCPWLANSSSSCFSEHAGIPPSLPACFRGFGGGSTQIATSGGG